MNADDLNPAYVSIALFVLAFVSARSLASLNETVAKQAIARITWIFILLQSLEVTTRAPASPAHLLIGLGFVVFVFSIALVIDHLFHTDPKHYLAVCSSTFGGGNRGYALIALLVGLPFLHPRKDEIVWTFFQIDSVIIIWLLFVVPALLHRLSKIVTTENRTAIPDSLKSFLSEVGFSPLLVALVVITSWAFPSDVKELVATILKPSSGQRSAILSYLAMTYVFLSSALGGHSAKDTGYNMLQFYLSRLVPIALAIAFAALALNLSIIQILLDVEFAKFTVPLLVLALCPPSSFFSTIAEKVGLSSDDIQPLSNLNVSTTIAFIAIFLAVIGFTLLGARCG